MRATWSLGALHRARRVQLGLDPRCSPREPCAHRVLVEMLHVPASAAAC
jgi:hypothetical protein